VTLIGADPEAFILHGKDKTPVPAHERGFPPKALPLRTDQGKLIRDGYAVEFNPTVQSCRYILSNVFYALMRNAAKRLQPGDGLYTHSTIEIDPATLEDAPSDVAEFGCEGAWNAYIGSLCKPEIHGPTHPYRYSGGHFHQSVGRAAETYVSWAKKLENVFLWAKMQDRYTGLISTYLTGSELSALRRRYYGQAGEFRLQDHGAEYAASLEYRTPGSEVFGHPAVLSLCLGLFRHIYEYFDQFKDSYDPTKEAQVRDAINAGVSHDDLLDLIPELPGWYSHKVLKLTRKKIAPLMHQDLVPNLDGYMLHTGQRGGWLEWCQSLGWNHYRDDYRSNDDRPLEMTEKLLKKNLKWEKEVA